MAASMLLQRGGDHALDDDNDSIATSLFVEVGVCFVCVVSVTITISKSSDCFSFLTFSCFLIVSSSCRSHLF